jgi:hypothetical protein
VILPVAALLLLRAQLTLQLGPVTADKALTVLSGLAGEKLVCSPELRAEIVMVRVKAVPWSELKSRLARVCRGQWRLRDREWILERPRSLADRLHAEAIDRQVRQLARDNEIRTRELQPWSSPYLNDLLTKLAVNAEKSYIDKTGRSSIRQALIDLSIEAPIGRALIRFLAKMDLRELCGLEPDSMRVLSDQPTPMEGRLPDSADILRSFLAEQKEFAAQLERRNDLFGAVDFLDPRFNTSTSSEPVTRFVMTLRRYGSRSIAPTLAAVDKAGWIVASTTLQQGFPDPKQSPLSSLPPGQIELSERGQDLNRSIGF